MTTGEIPYKGLSVQQIIGTVGFDDSFMIDIPKKGNQLILKLIRKCLNRDPLKRPKFTEIVEEI